MKRLSLILLAILSVCLLFSCSGSNNNPEETKPNNEIESQTSAENGESEPQNTGNEKGILTINPDDYFKCVVFELPEGDFRDAAVEHMREQAAVEWICSDDFSVTEKWENWGISLDFKKGQKYTGIPYSDTKVSLTEFNNNLVDGTYTSESDKWKDVLGVQCVSSIMNAIQQFCPDVSGTTHVLLPSYKGFEAQLCGEYTVPEDVSRTADIIAANTQLVMFEAYSHLKKGDIIITKDDTRGVSHVRMLAEDPVIVKNSAGRFNPSRSAVKTVEQTNQFDGTRNDVKTTWWIDHEYSFSTLYETNYIPLTLEIYQKDRAECEIPYLYLDKEITTGILEKGALSGSVKSNFPIRYVNIDIISKNGETVKHNTIHDMSSSYTVNLRNHAVTVFEGLENGQYKFVLTAGISIGEAELQTAEFYYNK